MRLRALKDSPTSFGSTYLRESQLTDDEWVARTENLNAHSRSPVYLNAPIAVEELQIGGLLALSPDY